MVATRRGGAGPGPGEPRRNLARRWDAVALCLLGLFLLLYVGSSYGLVSSNDGSHFATTRALAERGTFSVDRELAFALNDTSIHDGHRYSSKPPGTAILALPLYWLSRPLSDVLQRDPSPAEDAWHRLLGQLALDLEHPIPYRFLKAAYTESGAAQDTVALLACLSGVLALGCTYRSSRHLGASAWASATTVIALGAGTLLWRYSTAAFAHAVGAALLAVQFEWLLSGRALRTHPGAFGWGLLLGVSVAVEYQAALVLVPLLLGWFAELWRAGASRDGLLRFVPVAAGLAIPVAGLAWYQDACFGSPFSTAASATEHVEFWYTRSIDTMFSGSFRAGAESMLFSREARGLFYQSPIVVLALAGWLFWPRSRRRLLAVAFGIVALHCAVIFKVMAPEGGGTLDHRYLVRILPLVFLPLGLALDRWVAVSRSRPRGRTWLLAVGCVVLLLLLSTSATRSFESMADFMKHKIVFLDQGPEAAGKARAAFPSWDHWPLLTLSLALYAPACALAAWGHRKRGRRALGERAP